MPQHTVILTFDESGNVVPLSEDGTQVESTLAAQKGDEVRWTSPHGSVIIEFQGAAPFAAGDTAFDQFQAIAVAKGTFTYRCSVMAGGEKRGWAEKSGGVVIVGGSTRQGGGG